MTLQTQLINDDDKSPVILMAHNNVPGTIVLKQKTALIFLTRSEQDRLFAALDEADDNA